MADIRIKVAKDKAKLVKALKVGEGSTGPFQLKVIFELESIHS